MDNPEKLATYGTEDDDKQNKITTQYVVDITIRKQSQITLIRHEPSYKQLEVKRNRTNTNNVNKTWVLLQTTGGKDEQNKHK